MAKIHLVVHIESACERNETTLKLSILTVYKAMNSITLLFDVGYERNRQEVSILV